MHRQHVSNIYGRPAPSAAPPPVDAQRVLSRLQEVGQVVSRYTLQAAPRAYMDFLRAARDRRVVAVQVCREPLQDVYQAVWKVIGDEPAESVYHVFVRMTLDNGDVWRLEKNRRIAVNKTKSTSRASKCAPQYRLPQPKSVLEFMQAAEQQFVRDHGSLDWYFRYSALRYNCQQWLVNLLSSNDVPFERAFLLQDVRNDALSDVFQAATDVAGVVNWVQNDVATTTAAKR